MTYQLEITPEAEKDIFAIAATILQQDSPAAARRAVSALKQQLKTLAELPDSGRAGGCEGTREVVMTGLPYVVIYEIVNDTSVIIVRVLYGADEPKAVKIENQE